MSKPPILYARVSPAPSKVPGTITLYKHTWEDHISAGHAEVDFFHVKNAIDNPCYVCASATVPGSLVLVNEVDTNESGHALRVPIKPDGANNNIVTTAYYSSAKSHGTIIWTRGDDE